MSFQTLLHHQPPYLTLPSPSFPPNFIFAVSAQPRFVRRQISMPRNAVWNLGVRCQTSTSEAKCDDGFYIRRAVELARKATGCTSPNPMVGCVIVKNGEIVGQGFHPKAGQPHAEVFALRDAGELAEDATAYVSLEPCNHYGRTPPCSEALIKAKVKRVVVGMVDPNPIVASKGVEKLRSAGIEVTVGVEEELCKRLNEAYIHKMLTGKPFVTLRYALSVNGHLLDQLGEGAAECGGYYSKLLREYDAILSPASSLKEGLSLPTSREPGANQPLQILVAKDPNEAVQLPIKAHDPSKVIIFTDKETTKETELSGSGIETVVLDRISLDPILEYCNQQGKCSLLFDLRGDCGDYVEMVEECYEHNLVQKVVVEILPLWSGNQDEEASRWSLQNPKGIKKLNRLTTMLAGDNVVLEGYF